MPLVNWGCLSLNRRSIEIRRTVPLISINIQRLLNFLFHSFYSPTVCNKCKFFIITIILQSVPVLFGVPLTQYLNNGCESRAGFYFSGVCILTGFLTMFLINVHKNQLRRLRHSRHVHRHGTSVKSTSTKASDDSFLSPGPDPLIRRLSFEGEEDDLDILPAMALLHNQQFLQDIMGNNN